MFQLMISKGLVSGGFRRSLQRTQGKFRGLLIKFHGFLEGFLDFAGFLVISGIYTREHPRKPMKIHENPLKSL